MLLDLGIAQLKADRLQFGERALLVLAHQPRIARDIGREDRGEPTFDASWPCGLHGASPVVDDPTPTGAAHALSKGATSRLLGGLCASQKANWHGKIPAAVGLML